MIVIWTFLKSRAGQALALLGVFMGWLAMDRHKQRKRGAQDVRRRAEASAEARKEDRDEIDNDVANGNANERLRSDGWTRD